MKKLLFSVLKFIKLKARAMNTKFNDFSIATDIVGGKKLKLSLKGSASTWYEVKRIELSGKPYVVILKAGDEQIIKLTDIDNIKTESQ
jgi:hypothetical protein